MNAHQFLVESAYKWVLKNASCGFAFKELSTIGDEIPDVIGFGSHGHSVLIECKASRSDFLQDRNKSFRKTPEKGMGMYRYFCCFTGLIKQHELPTGWGLLYATPGGKCTKQFYPKIEVMGGARKYFADYKHERNKMAEQSMMYSALRRLQKRGRIEEIYIPFESFEAQVTLENIDQQHKLL